MKKFAAFLVYLIAFVVILGVACMFLGYAVSSGDTNLRYVYVGEYNVSGLTRDETEQLLESKGWKTKEQSPLVVTTLRGVSFTVDPVRSGVVTPVETLVEKAYAVGHRGDMISNLLTAIDTFRHPVDVSRIEREIDTAYLDSLIDACMERIQEGLGDEDYIVDTEAEQLVMIKGGRRLGMDKADFRSEIIRALESGQTELRYARLTADPQMPDFDAIHAALWKEPADASYASDGSFAVIDEVVGCRFDVQQARAIWESAQPGDEVRIPLEIERPSITGEFLRSLLFRDLLGACTTKFPNSGENRRSNLQLCASKINGYVVYPGEIFSYNEVVGARTEEAGFKPAPAYVDGAEKEEIGGGACQISSTLYAATAFAFLETVERSSHVFKVSYMQRGTDATVTIPAEGKIIDFKFANNKIFPIKIVTYYNDEESTITVEIWGTLTPNDYMPIEFDNSSGWEHDYDRFIDPAYPDRPGYTIKFSVEMWGFEDELSSGYRTLTHRLVIDEEGNVVDDQILNGELPSGGYALDTYYQHP